MPHNPTDGIIPTFDSGVDLADFVAEVTFTAPHSSSMASWSSGFLIRQTGSNRFARGRHTQLRKLEPLSADR